MAKVVKVQVLEPVGPGGRAPDVVDEVRLAKHTPAWTAKDQAVRSWVGSPRNIEFSVSTDVR
jgi:hypothetical protein